MRKSLLLIAVALAAAVGFSMSTLRAVASRAVESSRDSLGKRARLTVGGIHLVLLPRPAVEVRGVRIVSRQRDEKEPLLTVAIVRIYPKLLGMLIGRASVARVEAVKPVLRLRHERGGEWTGLAPLVLLARPPVGSAIHAGRILLEDLTTTPVARVDVDLPWARLEPARSGAAVQFTVESIPFGPTSTGHFEGTFVQGTGPTGGHRLDLGFELRGEDIDALQRALPALTKLALGGPYSLSGTMHGWLGEHSTEDTPAEPLEGVVRGRVGLAVLGLSRALDFDLDTSLDDQRLRINHGTASWGDLPLTVTGWAQARRDGRIEFRAKLEDVDVGSVATAFEVAQRWRPEARLSGTLKVEGTTAEPRITYAAVLKDLRLEPWAGWPLLSPRLKVNGTLAAINADVSASCEADRLRIGRVALGQLQFGVVYWRDKLSVTALNLPLWDGTASVSGAYYPKQEKSLDAGGVFDDLDAAKVTAGLLPDTDLALGGRLDTLLQLGTGEQGLWAMGRVGLHRGKLGEHGIVREVFQSIASVPGMQATLGPAILRAHRRLLSPGPLQFRRLAFDFQQREEGISLRSLDFELSGASIRAQALVDSAGRLSAWGDMNLGPALTADLKRRVPELSGLIAPDGRLHVPVTIEGPLPALQARAEDRFLDALLRASQGGIVNPFLPVEQSEGIEMDLPSLAEQFGR